MNKIRRTVERLRSLLEVRGLSWTMSGGEELGEYFRGHLDSLTFATDGLETRARIYELARQVGFTPTIGRVAYLAMGSHDPLVDARPVD